MLNIINELNSTSSIKEKQKILEENKNNDLFKKILKITYDNNYIFNISKLPTPEKHTNELSLNDAIEEIVKTLVFEKLRGKKAQSFLKNIFEKVSKEDYEVLKLIIKKDLKCGVNKKLINKVFPNLIYEHKYLGAIPFDEKKIKKLLEKDKYLFSQEKLDGEYLALIKKDKILKTETRNGKDANLKKIFENILKDFDNIVLIGEVLVKDFNRYEANGALNSYKTIIQKRKENKNFEKDIKNFEKRYKISIEEFEDKIYLIVWDILDYDSYINENAEKYEERFEKLKKILKELNSNKLQLVETKKVTSFEEIFNHYAEIISKGGEGTVVKSPNVKFKNKRVNEIVKIKPQFTIDLKIIDLIFGNEGTKYENFINKIQVESKDGLVKAQVAGLTEKDMKYFTKHKDKLIGKIVEIKASFLSKDKNGNYGLLHPSFVKLREDKDEANTLNEIIEISKMINYLKKNN